MAEHLLDDELQDLQLVPASREKRLANFLIDYLVIICSVLLFYLLFADLEALVDESSDRTLDNLRGMLFYLAYYIAIEGMSEGKSLGKWITNTRVVSYRGLVTSTPQMIQRTLIRLIPFEPLSALGEAPPWHDRWSNTLVVDETQSKLPY